MTPTTLNRMAVKFPTVYCDRNYGSDPKIHPSAEVCSSLYIIVPITLFSLFLQMVKSVLSIANKYASPEYSVAVVEKLDCTSLIDNPDEVKSIVQIKSIVGLDDLFHAAANHLGVSHKYMALLDRITLQYKDVYGCSGHHTFRH
jgi:hypothetical protein